MKSSACRYKTPKKNNKGMRFPGWTIYALRCPLIQSGQVFCWYNVSVAIILQAQRYETYKSTPPVHR